MPYAALLDEVTRIGRGCKWIVWTGGEPTDQLHQPAVDFFAAAGFKQAIETSGVRPVPPGLDWVTVSPKVAEHVLKRSFIGQRIDELKYVRCIGHSVPEPLVTADHYFIQPHATGGTVDPVTLNHCIELCKAHPQWTLSLQTHKLLQIR